MTIEIRGIEKDVLIKAESCADCPSWEGVNIHGRMRWSCLICEYRSSCSCPPIPPWCPRRKSERSVIVQSLHGAGPIPAPSLAIRGAVA